MSYFVTGATGFLGRFLVQELLDHHDGEVFVLVRPSSRHKLDQVRRTWGDDARVVPVEGDLTQDDLGVSHQWATAHRDDVTHFFHVAAVYDMTADDAVNQAMNVEGTRHALDLAAKLDVRCFHHVSSVAVAGDYRGMFDESMFDEGQGFSSPYHRTKFDAEQLVRRSDLTWRVYRPSVIVGHSETGQMDKVDGPYYFFPFLKRMRDTLPSWTPLVGVDLGDTNVVTVDYVASAMAWLAHQPGLDGRAFHLVNPDPQPVVEVVNTFADAAHAPRFATPIDRKVTGLLPDGLLPRAVQPSRLLRRAVASAPAQLALRETVGRLGIPPEVVAHSSFSALMVSSRTQKALNGSGISVPDLEASADALFQYWEEFLDDSIRRDKKVVGALQGKTVLITGASSGIGLVTAVKVAKAGAIPLLVARGKDKLEDLQAEIEADGGAAFIYPCDLSDMDAIDSMCEQVCREQKRVDFVINNAGRSIRRSLKLSVDRFHDFERTMQLNYFGAIRLVMGLMPAMTESGGHVVNVSSIGVQTNPPRFSAYVASKSALDSWSNVVSSELVGDGISFTTIHMPLVRTPMIAPTKIYDRFPTISPSQAAEMVVKAMVDKPHQINTALGNLGAVAGTVSPKLTFRILHLAYQVFPDSAAARGDKTDPTNEQMLLARLMKGVHW
ncbi:SDR family oxidoreductase [Nocardioidaceae bacterium]|nr:SDR family oxidoreductase [Nocardioidaceae bacterium]